MRARLVVIWLVVQALSASADAAPGDLDTSFGPGGYVQLFGAATGLSLLPDGRIVVAMPGYPRSTLLRLLSTGAADTSFGTAGRAEVPNSLSGGLARQPSGKLVAFGEVPGGTRCLSLARVDQDGAVDATFGIAGSVPTGPAMPCDPVVGFLGPWSGSVGVQSTGQIIAAFGWGIGARGPFIAAAARNLVDGAVDASFGQGGTATTENGRQPVIAVDAADRILLTDLWDTAGAAVAIRLTPLGERDATFGQGGAARPPAGAEASIDGVVVQHDGAIVTAGWGWGGSVGGTGGPLTIVRYLADGTPDPSFGAGGFAIVRPPNPDAQRVAIVVQPDGRIVVAANLPSSSPGIVVVRLLPDGSPDATFGSNGIVTTAPIYFTPGIVSMAIQPDGKILVLTSNGILLRYLGGAAAAAAVEVPALASALLAVLAALVVSLATVALRRRPRT
jgi:uncharacterized delta-60 repeat protein